MNIYLWIFLGILALFCVLLSVAYLKERFYPDELDYSGDCWDGDE